MSAPRSKLSPRLRWRRVVAGLALLSISALVAGSAGASAGSFAQLVAAADVPGAPVGVSAVAMNGLATVTFRAPASDGGAAITSYTVTSSPGQVSASGTESPIVVPGLTNGTPYTFTVRATNEAGQGPASAPSNGVIPGPGANWSQRGGKLSTSGGFGFETALSVDGNTMMIGAPYDSNAAGAAWVLIRSGGSFATQQKLVASGESGQGLFGWTVALSGDGNTALVGGPNDSSGAGAAWVFTRSGSTWTQQGAKLTGGGASGQAFFGYNVALSADGNTALIGGYNDNGGRGAAWVFVRSGGTWSQQGGKLTGTSDSDAGFGLSVSLSGDADTAVIGSPFDGEYTGSAFVFVRSGGVWSQNLQLNSGTGIGAALFGISVALSTDGRAFVVGGSDDNNGVGAAWVFNRGTAGWGRGPKLTPTGNAGAPAFGYDVSLSGDGKIALIGGPGDNNSVGAAWAFYRVGTNWPQQGAKLTGSSPSGASGFGAAVSLSGNGVTSVIGGPEDSPGGAAWIFGPPPPVAASGVTAVAGIGQASVSFTAPPGPILGYTVIGSPGNINTAGTSSPIVVPGLTAGVSYTFTVSAYSDSGPGSLSAASNAVVPLGPPGAPTAVSATGGDGQALVTFTPPASNGGSPVSYYTVTASPGGVSASGAGSPVAIFGLTNGVSYTFTVTATNGVGRGPQSTASGSVVPAGGERPHPALPAEAPRPEVPDPPPPGPRVPPPDQ